MKSCRSALWVLLLLTITTGSESAVPTVKVTRHAPAVLPCSERCSGVVRWTVSDKPTDILAECDQTSCRSVKEGYQMMHDQYLKGDLYLTITEADFSKGGWYTCDCDDKDQCDVLLQIEGDGDGSEEQDQIDEPADSSPSDTEPVVSLWVTITASVVALVTVIVGLVVVMRYRSRIHLWLESKMESSNGADHTQNGIQENGQSNHSPEKERLSPSTNDQQQV